MSAPGHPSSQDQRRISQLGIDAFYASRKKAHEESGVGNKSVSLSRGLQLGSIFGSMNPLRSSVSSASSSSSPRPSSSLRLSSNPMHLPSVRPRDEIPAGLHGYDDNGEEEEEGGDGEEDLYINAEDVGDVAVEVEVEVEDAEEEGDEKGQDTQGGKSDEGGQPTHQMSSNTVPEKVRALVEQGGGEWCQVGHIGEWATKLHIAAEYGDLAWLREAIAKLDATGSDGINRVDSDRVTALHKASEYDYPSCVNALIAAGAGITLRDKLGETPLHKAAKNGSLECMRLLLEEGLRLEALPGWRDGDRRRSCLSSWLGCWFVGRAASTHGGLYINTPDYTGETALHKASKWGRAGAVKEGVQILLEVERQSRAARLANAGAGKLDRRAVKRDKILNKRNFDGHTPCHLAAFQNRRDLLKLLIQSYDARFKNGTLNEEDRRTRERVFLGGMLLALALTAVYFCSLFYLPSGWKRPNTKTTGCLTYYNDSKGRGLVLQSNLILFLGVFGFTFGQWLVVMQIIPALHFAFHYLHFRLRRAYNSRCPKGRWYDHTYNAASNRRRGRLRGSGAGRASVPGAVGGAASAGGAGAGGGAAGGVGGGSIWEDQNPLTIFYIRQFDADKAILHSWRVQKYLSLVYLKPSCRSWQFCLSAQYLFLYLQIAWTVWTIGVAAQRDLESGPAERSALVAAADEGFSPWRRYLVFYGSLVNSPLLSTAFSLFHMVVFERRWEQFYHARRNLRLFGAPVGYLWVAFVASPALVLLPPMLSHVLPAMALYGWLLLFLAAVYYGFLHVHRALYPKDFKSLFAQVARGQPSLSRTDLRRHFRLHARLVGCSHGGILDACRADGSAKGDAVTAEEFEGLYCTLLDAPELQLWRYYFWFLLEIFARFVFILLFQLLFDAASILYETEGPAGHMQGKYTRSLTYAYTLRSQSLCYLVNLGTRGLNWAQIVVGGALLCGNVSGGACRSGEHWITNL